MKLDQKILGLSHMLLTATKDYIKVMINKITNSHFLVLASRNQGEKR